MVNQQQTPHNQYNHGQIKIKVVRRGSHHSGTGSCCATSHLTDDRTANTVASSCNSEFTNSYTEVSRTLNLALQLEERRKIKEILRHAPLNLPESRGSSKPSPRSSDSRTTSRRASDGDYRGNNNCSYSYENVGDDDESVSAVCSSTSSHRHRRVISAQNHAHMDVNKNQNKMTRRGSTGDASQSTHHVTRASNSNMGLANSNSNSKPSHGKFVEHSSSNAVTNTKTSRDPPGDKIQKMHRPSRRRASMMHIDYTKNYVPPPPPPKQSSSDSSHPKQFSRRHSMESSNNDFNEQKSLLLKYPPPPPKPSNSMKMSRRNSGCSTTTATTVTKAKAEARSEARIDAKPALVYFC